MANPILNHLTGVAARFLVGSALDRVEGRVRNRAERRHQVPGAAELLEEIDLTHLQPLPPLPAPDLPDPTGFQPDPATLSPELAEAVAAGEAEPAADDGLPRDLFRSVSGHETEKRYLTAALRSHRRLNILLVGDAGTGKSALLDEVSRVPGSRTVGGADLTAAGLRKMYLEPEGGAPPRILIVDELDRMKPEAVGTMRRLLEGKVSAATHGAQRDEHVDVRVIAACNDPRRIDPAILDRFIRLDMHALAPEERRLFLTEYLMRTRHLPPDTAAEIAELVAPRSASVREAEKVATLYQQDPDLAIRLAAQPGGAAGG